MTEADEIAWCIASQSGAIVENLCQEMKLPPLICRVLVNRGFRDEESCKKYLAPSSHHLEEPCAFRHMDQAVERVFQAIDRDEKILIQGDYDVDGSASSALLVLMFRLFKVEAEVSIPSRAEDGYGLNERIIRKAAQDGVKLLITCDNGTTACDEVKLANELGIDTIITDHHTVGPTLPEALAVINPHIQEDEVAYRDLCGAGVAFKLAWACLNRASKGEILDKPFKDFLASAQSLVALASVADVVPLTGENRVLTRQGLIHMPNSPNPGIRALMELSGLDKIPTGRDVGFKLAPRLNAGGRMGRESLAVELLTARSYGEAMDLAREMDSLNKDRQALDRELTKQAIAQVEADPTYEQDRVLVVENDNFHAGVVGIVAARLCRKFNKPSVLIAMQGDVGRGSGRSIPGFHLYNALNECNDLMARFGGHAQAAGLEITRENVGQLRAAVNKIADKHIIKADYDTKTLDIDTRVELEDLDLPSVKLLSRLEPFGEGNRPPLFATEDVTIIANPRVVGRGTGHLSLIVKQGSTSFKAIGFSMGARVDEFKRGDTVRLAFVPIISEFKGYPEVEIEIKDIRV
ncbi:MAG: single-stranded-DNA-specific exonuclease RecJ [Planctomycetes bacterium]|nr:single-stranded-DNA-specific exonuclease RecJ [Planctomycetota bacterium]